MREVRRMLHEKISHDQIVKAIETRGLGFRFIAGVEARLKREGFSAEHIAKIKALSQAESNDESGSTLEEVDAIANRYPRDRGITRSRDVLALFTFENDRWRNPLRVSSDEKNIITFDRRRREVGFEPLIGSAMAMHIQANTHSSGTFLYDFAAHHRGQEPEAIYFRYYLRFSENWDGLNGKLPGFGGTYDRGGWGGKPSDGKNGWSARGLFGKIRDVGVPIGTYCYHAKMKGQYGDSWWWDCEPLQRNRWYCVEQYLKLNTPGQPDGIIRAWVDGKPVFDKTDIQFRDTDALKIERIWGNAYHGGKTPAQSDDTLFVDNLIIAKRYIGPIKTDR